MKNRLKIALVGGKYARNCGDALIFESTKSLLMLAAQELDIELEIIELDHFAAKAAPKRLEYPRENLAGKQSDESRSRLKIYRISPRLSRNIKDIKWYVTGRAKKYRKFIDSELRGVQALFFAGGGIFKFMREGFHLRNFELVRYCEKNDIPVYFNAVGVEGFDRGYIGCAMLSHIAKSKMVRFITTRDFADVLKARYKTTACCYRTADPAVCCATALGVEKNDSAKTVGIGVVRGRLFLDHGIVLPEDRLICLYKELVSILESHNIEWKLYTTGVKGDMLTALRLLDELGESRDRLCRPPCSAQELLEQMSGFCCTIAGRMHACIAAYALDIPAVGLCWNEKLSAFGELIQRPESFLHPDELDPQTIFARLEQARELGYEEQRHRDLQLTVSDAIREMLCDLYESTFGNDESE